MKKDTLIGVIFIVIAVFLISVVQKYQMRNLDNIKSSLTQQELTILNDGICILDNDNKLTLKSLKSKNLMFQSSEDTCIYKRSKLGKEVLKTGEK